MLFRSHEAYESSASEALFEVDEAVTDNVDLVGDALSVGSVTIYQDSDQSSDNTSVVSIHEGVLAPELPICRTPHPGVGPVSTVSAVRGISARLLGEGVRTTLGRIIKPVNRLIQTMSTQEIKRFLDSR